MEYDVLGYVEGPFMLENSGRGGSPIIRGLVRRGNDFK